MRLFSTFRISNRYFQLQVDINSLLLKTKFHLYVWVLRAVTHGHWATRLITSWVDEDLSSVKAVLLRSLKSPKSATSSRTDIPIKMTLVSIGANILRIHALSSSVFRQLSFVSQSGRQTPSEFGIVQFSFFSSLLPLDPLQRRWQLHGVYQLLM